MRSLKLNLIIFVSLCFMLACGKDEESSDCEGQTMSGTFKGASWEMESITNATILKGTDPTTSKMGYRLDIVAKGKDGSTLSIIVNEFEKGIRGDCMDVTKTWSTQFYENYYDPIDFSVEIAIFSYVDKAGNGFTTLAEELDGRFNLTSCDETNHKISGTFTFAVKDEESNEVTFSNGKFNNICFTVR